MNSSPRCIVIFVLCIAAVLLILPAAGEGNGGIEIIVVPKTGKGPMWVHVEPRVNNLKEPLKFRWYFGDGQESGEMYPKPHFYEVGKYNLVLEVTEQTGKVYTASATIDAASPG
ncbi:MAG: hypothetical protein K8I29_03825 [Alphaproteobacteria bacterium]|uniref:PKD domain-containing protein n=1 Tax=Candidatus Nitrobium versatile TaxID=2884831 RepID=A0A953M1B3_9BACT|nr:hypothetical protein [Candidatus Nitrobium versatile]